MGLPDGEEVFWRDYFLFQQPEQGVDELARVFPAVFPAREGFLAAAEKVGELVLRKGKTLAQGPNTLLQEFGYPPDAVSTGMITDGKTIIWMVFTSIPGIEFAFELERESFDTRAK